MKKYEQYGPHDPSTAIVPENLFANTDKKLHAPAADDAQVALNALSAWVSRYPELATPEELAMFVEGDTNANIDK